MKGRCERKDDASVRHFVNAVLEHALLHSFVLLKSAESIAFFESKRRILCAESNRRMFPCPFAALTTAVLLKPRLQIESCANIPAPVFKSQRVQKHVSEKKIFPCASSPLESTKAGHMKMCAEESRPMSCGSHLDFIRHLKNSMTFVPTADILRAESFCTCCHCPTRNITLASHHFPYIASCSTELARVRDGLGYTDLFVDS